ncbi:MAG: putative PurR-regulated permease PerM, partial [Candidatus Azotimanducaceae bacterium]
MLYLGLIAATLFTSLVSGVLSMAGGMILMGIFGLFLSIPTAMVLHGIAQAVSNGSRIWLHRQHIRWGVLLPYALGSLVVLA